MVELPGIDLKRRVWAQKLGADDLSFGPSMAETGKTDSKTEDTFINQVSLWRNG